MHQVVGLISNVMHNHTYCFFVYVPVHTGYIPGHTWFVSVHTSKSFLMARYKKVCTHLSHIQQRIYHARVWYFYILQCTCTYHYIPPCAAGHNPEHLSCTLTNAVCTCTENAVLCTNCLFLRKHEILRIVTSSTRRYHSITTLGMYWYVWRRAVFYYSMVHTGLYCVCTSLYCVHGT
jgi:hypothetical protein